jgi:predicted porin
MKFPAKTLIALAVAGVVAPGAALAMKTEAKLGGQISRMVIYADNGVQDDVLHTDNNNSGTRTRLRGDTDLGNGMKAGIIWETDWQFNDSASMDIGDADLDKCPENRLRDLYFSGAFGKISMGRGNGAANGTSEIGYSGTWIAGNSGDFHLGGLNFRTKDGSKEGATVSRYGQVFNNLDGLSRNNRLRYDTPALGPVVLSADFGQEKWELAARLSQKTAGGGKIGAAIGWVDTDNTEGGVGGFKGDQVGMSGSWLSAAGFNVTGFWGQRNLDNQPAGRDDPKAWWLQAGYKMGANNLAVSYGETNDMVQQEDKGKRLALTWVHNMKDHGVEIYAGLWKAELDRPGVAVEDLNGLFVGSRVKF